MNSEEFLIKLKDKYVLIARCGFIYDDVSKKLIHKKFGWWIEDHEHNKFFAVHKIEKTQSGFTIENRIGDMFKNSWVDKIKFAVTFHALPSTPNWDDTLWLKDLKKAISKNYKYIYTINEDCLYEIISENQVKNIIIH
jgi:hypothetical protein